MTRAQIEDIIWQATVKVLGLDPQAEATQSKVRISWPLSETGNSNWQRDENVVFIRLAPTSDDYSSLWELSHADSNGEYVELVSNQEAYETVWLCYGPDALEYAQKLRYGLGREDIRAYLNVNSMAFKPVVAMPTHMPEQDRSGEWWERYDVRAQMYCKQVRQYSEGYIDTTPNITVEIDDSLPPLIVDDGDGNLSPNPILALEYYDFLDGNIFIKNVEGKPDAIKVRFVDKSSGEIYATTIR